VLRTAAHVVHDLAEGPCRFSDGILSLDRARLTTLVERDPRVRAARIHLVRPGDRTRVANVLDVFDARRKAQGPTYPGFDGPPVTAGSGDLHVLRGFQLVGSAHLPTGGGGVRVARRAFVDFWDVGATASPFGNALTAVVEIAPASDLDQQTADNAVRDALIAVSIEIGALAMDLPPDSVEESLSFPERPVSGDLPRVAYVYQVQSHGALLDTYLYGVAIPDVVPTVIDTTEILDGALVSGTRGRITTPTILHCNNPVVRSLAARHGDSINLLPVILMEGHHKTTPQKERSARHAVQLLRLLGADGAIFTQEGGGMSIVDQMLTIEEARASGIESVGITYEMAGVDGVDRPLIYFSRAARNLVSTGNRDELVRLAAPERVIGQDPIEIDVRSNGSGDGAASAPGASTERSESLDLTREVEVPVWCLYGSVSQVGAGRMRGHSA
jgi:glycine reductase